MTNQALYCKIVSKLWQLEDAQWFYLMQKTGSYLSIFRSLPEKAGLRPIEDKDKPDNEEEILNLISLYKDNTQNNKTNSVNYE